MTSSPGKGAPRPEPAKDRRALKPYIDLQIKYDRQTLQILRDALRTVNNEMRKLARKEGIGARIRESQLVDAKREIFQTQANIWRQLGDLVRVGRYEAAAAGVDSTSIYDEVLFSAIGEEELFNLIKDGMKAYARNAIALGNTRLTTSAIQLSQNVYDAQSLSTGQLEWLLNALLARGSSAREIAAAVRGFIDPTVPGGVSYAALRLGRTELNNAFHASQALSNSTLPWVEATQWNLSGSHLQPDECDDFAANTDYNGNPGQFASTDVPPNPHPQCLCFLTPVLMDQDSFMQGLSSGKFDTFISRFS